MRSRNEPMNEAAGRRGDRGLWWDRAGHSPRVCPARSPRRAAGAGPRRPRRGCSRSAVARWAGACHPHRRGRLRTGRGGGSRRSRNASGNIDVWVNDAMATVFAQFVDTEPEEFKRATEVTYLGAVYGTMAALRRMTARDHGTIIQVGSALSYRAIPLQAAYCGAKFAIRGSPTRSAPSYCTTRARSDHDGPAAGREHDAVQLVSFKVARASEAGPADLPARDSRRSDLLGGAAPPP